MDLPLLKQAILSQPNQHPLISVAAVLRQASYSVTLSKMPRPRASKHAHLPFSLTPASRLRQSYHLTLTHRNYTESLSIFVIPPNANLLFTRPTTPIHFQFNLPVDVSQHLPPISLFRAHTFKHWLEEQPGPISFQIQPRLFALNLKLLDSRLDEILAWMLWYAFLHPKSEYLLSLIQAIDAANPVGFDLSARQPFYANKFERFLAAAVTGEILSHPRSDLLLPLYLVCFIEPNRIQVFDQYQLPALLTYLMPRVSLSPQIQNARARDDEHQIPLGMQLRMHPLKHHSFTFPAG